MKEETIDYKNMYLTLVRATEQAINLLIHAQQQCEEIYISSSDRSAPFDNPSIIIV